MPINAACYNIAATCDRCALAFSANGPHWGGAVAELRTAATVNTKKNTVRCKDVAHCGDRMARGCGKSREERRADRSVVPDAGGAV